MATPNYGYEKRQRELEKKRKKEEKARAKAERKSGEGGDGPELDDGATDAAAGSDAPVRVAGVATAVVVAIDAICYR